MQILLTSDQGTKIMSTHGTKAKSQKTTKKRTYVTDPSEKLKEGKPWILHFEVERDIAERLIKDKKENGGDYAVKVNNLLRKAMRLPKAS